MRFMLVFASLLVVHSFEPQHGPATLHRPTLPAQRRAVAVYALPKSAANRGELLTLSMQSLHLAMFGGGLLQPEAMDSMVASFSDTFRSLGFTADKMFEADLAVAAFVLWIAFFESVSFVPGNERWRLDGQPALNPLRGFGRDLHKSVVPAVTYLASIAAFHHFHLGTLLFGEKPPLDSLPPPTYWRVVSEVGLGVFLYDLLFYPFHASFHKLRVGPWRRHHTRHHQWAGKERVAHNAVETVQNSYLDAGIQVSINILVQNISPWGYKDPLSRALHNLMVTYLLTEAHSGYDLPFMSHRLFPRVFGGAPRHELHHQHGNVYFHQFSTELTRTARGLRWVRTGYAYQPPALGTYRRRRAACPQGPTYCTYGVRVPASGVGYVQRTVATQVLHVDRRPRGLHAARGAAATRRPTDRGRRGCRGRRSGRGGGAAARSHALSRAGRRPCAAAQSCGLQGGTIIHKTKRLRPGF